MINTNKKILNKNYLKFSSTPIEIESRKIVGAEFDIDEIDNIPGFILNQKNDDFTNVIREFYKNNFY